MRFLLGIVFLFLLSEPMSSQCAYTCSNYVVFPITYTTYPANGNTLTLADDDVSAPIPIGFTFEFFCINNAQLRVCSNGFLTFDLFSFISTAQTPYAQSMPSNTAPNDVIAWNWNDLDPSVGGSVTYTTIGTSPNQMFVLTWTNVPMWNIGGSYSGQIVLHETTNFIDFYTYSAGNNGWLTHTQGIENLTGTTGFSVPGRNLSLWSVNPNQPSAWRFSPYSTPSPGSVTGPTLLCEGTVGQYSITPVNGALGYMWTLPNGWTGSSTATAISATAGVTGNVSVAAVYTCAASPPVFYAVTVTPAPFVSVLQATPQVVCTGDTAFISMTGANQYTLQPGNLISNGFLTPTPFVNTTYSITGTDTVTGCASLNTANINILTIPSPTISVNSGAICIGETFTIQPFGADHYKFSTLFPVVTPTNSGLFTYTVIGTGSLNGCESLPALSTVTVHPKPNVTAIATRSAICANESNTLIAGGAQDYLWNAGYIASTIVITPTLTATYTVTGTSSEGCTATATVYVKVSSCAGIDETETKSVRIFPNPSQGQLFIQAQLPADFALYDAGGRLVFTARLENDHRIDLSGIAPGLYQVLLITEGIAHPFKLIIIE